MDDDGLGEWINPKLLEQVVPNSLPPWGSSEAEWTSMDGPAGSQVASSGHSDTDITSSARHRGTPHRKQSKGPAAPASTLLSDDTLALVERCSSHHCQSNSAPQQIGGHHANSRSSCNGGSSSSSGNMVPNLNFSKLKTGKETTFSRNLSVEELQQPVSATDDELTFEDEAMQVARPAHPHAPVVDNRCYVYRAVAPDELLHIQELLSRLPEPQGKQVADIWNALLTARHDCEAMAARGVRVSRDVSRDWQETVSDLIDRVVTQDREIANLKQQLRAVPTDPKQEELQSQVVRLKRQRDKLSRDNQEIAHLLQDTQDALALAHCQLANVQGEMSATRSKTRQLYEQHASLLKYHIDLNTYTEQLEAEVTAYRTNNGAAAMAAAASPRAESPAGGLLHMPHVRPRNSPRHSPRGFIRNTSPTPAGGYASAVASALGRSKMLAQSAQQSELYVCSRGSSFINSIPAGSMDQFEDPQEVDSHELDQFDQQPTSAGHTNSNLAPGGKFNQQRLLRPATPEHMRGLDFGSHVEWCKQQLESMAALTS